MCGGVRPAYTGAIKSARPLRARLTFANVMVVLLTFIVLGGGAYATTLLPKNSVGTKQLKNGVVTQQKIALAAQEALRSAHDPQGERGPEGPRGERGPQGDAAVPGETIPVGVTLRGVVVASMTEPTSGSFGIGD